LPTRPNPGGTDGQRRARRRLDGRRDGGLRREQINVTRIAPALRKEADAAKKEKPGRTGKKVGAKNLAVFTRQFSVMIDAGLPLVQCLDILGSQEEDKNFAFVIGATRMDVESGASLADADAQAPEDVRSPVHEHDRRRRGGRHPRHDSEAARDLTSKKPSSWPARSSRR
jgi:type II secretory pathway component PulF